MGIIENLLAVACTIATTTVAKNIVSAITNRNGLELKRYLPKIVQKKELMAEAIVGFEPEVLTLNECATILTTCKNYGIDDIVFRKRLTVALSTINAFMNVL